MKDLFKEIDTDTNGSVSWEELHEALDINKPARQAGRKPGPRSSTLSDPEFPSWGDDGSIRVEVRGG